MSGLLAPSGALRIGKHPARGVRDQAGIRGAGTKDGHRYCAIQRPRINDNGRLQFRYLLNFDLSEKTRDLKAGDLLDEPAMAPQAEQIDPLLKAISDETWESSFLDILHVLCQSRSALEKVDPLLRLHLVHKTLEGGCQGSYPLTESLGPQLKLARGSKISPSTNWLDPDDADGAPCARRPSANSRPSAIRRPCGPW